MFYCWFFGWLFIYNVFLILQVLTIKNITMKLKLCSSLLLCMSTFLLVAQQEDFVSNTWYLEKLIIEGEDYISPQNQEVNQSTLTIDSDNSVFYINFCYGGMAEGLSFSGENYFTIDIFVAPAMSCEIQENSYYQNLYFDFISDNVQLPFYYEITEEANNLKKLVITDNNNNQAVYYNAPVPQITLIPDPLFEQALIDINIDSDGTINGQVLTSEIESVTELIILDNYSISDMTGIQDFISLEVLNLNHNLNLTSLDVSNNLALRILDVSQNSLTELNLSNNILLEELYCGNPTDDIWPQNEIQHINLSNNPNIHTIGVGNMSSLEWINLNNGNNSSDMTIYVNLIYYGMWDDPDYDPNDIFNTICIEVDDEVAAQNNSYPYSEWDIFDLHTAINFTDDVVACSLNTPSFEKNKISIYPNPVADILYFDTTGSVDKIMIFDMSGRTVLEENYLNSVSVSHLQRGTYILKIFTDRGVHTEKIWVK